MTCQEYGVVPSGEKAVPRHEAGCRWGIGKDAGSVLFLGPVSAWWTDRRAQAGPQANQPAA